LPVTIEQVEQIARLAKLQFSEAEMHVFMAQFNEILAYIEKLNELDLHDVPAMTFVGANMKTLREDEQGPSLTPDEALANAPRRSGDFFSVPKVLGG
jgi:aspartyl-tRNA(Asn)/glutamyl-tRNA(Gln) amidotransferase subunit C